MPATFWLYIILATSPSLALVEDIKKSLKLDDLGNDFPPFPDPEWPPTMPRDEDFQDGEIKPRNENDEGKIVQK